MKRAILLFVSASILTAQTCYYQLIMNDALGDGWNGNELEVIVKRGSMTKSDIVTLPDPPGDIMTLLIAVQPGDSIILNYLGGGSWNSEVSFTLTDCQGNILYDSGTGPFTGIHYADTAECNACTVTGVNCASLTVSDVNVNFVFVDNDTVVYQVNINSILGLPTFTYVADFDTAGVAAGQGNISIGTIGENDTVGNLTPTSSYRLYVRIVCGVGDTSSWLGPYNVATLCDPLPVPYLETFDNVTPPALPICWETTDPTLGYSTSNCTGATGNTIRVEGAPNTAVTSPTFDLSGYSGVKVSYIYRRGGVNCGELPDFGDSIAVEFWDGMQWKRLTAYNGSDAPSVFTYEEFVIPMSQISNPTVFRIRFRIIWGAGPGFDTWEFDSVRITPPVRDLAIVQSTVSKDTLCQCDSLQWNINILNADAVSLPAALYIIGPDYNDTVDLGNVPTTGMTFIYNLAPKQTGTGVYYAIVKLTSGAPDVQPANDSTQKTITVLPIQAQLTAPDTLLVGEGGLAVLNLTQCADFVTSIFWFLEDGSSFPTQPGVPAPIQWNSAGVKTVKALIYTSCAGVVDTLIDSVYVKSLASAVAPTLQDIKIYPNPVKDNLYIQFPSVAMTYEIRLFNISGKQLYYQRTQQRSLTIPIEHLPVGVYLLDISDGVQHARYQIIKQ